ncbi:PTS sugar transporter subunit IIA [Enterococcus dongliensis]|uniref:PTS sugar transporter subunit IIA n=1 Tax=Enterococcus dongliensis TaxID=2559925 RepID=UPI0028919B48|nr:PTS sugar transporter subunit IIA [Enterococcus dongliensis]MDT2704228.1 PTS sugar transporter subunit IIA [Enterococcus dongliensis]
MKYLIATHGDFSTGLINSLDLIIGNGKQIDFFKMTKDKSASDAEGEVRQYLNQYKNEEIIVFTDVFGGSVANIFTQFLLEEFSFHLITGVNLPMLLSIILNSNDNLEEVIQVGIEEGNDGIKYINKVLNEQKGEMNNDSIIIED